MLGLGGLVGQLWEDGRGLVVAEVQLAKSKALAVVHRSRNAVILFLAAAVVAFVSLIGLVLGFVLALVPIVGAVLAGVIVLTGGLVLAGLLGWLGARSLSSPAAAPETGS